MARERSQEKDRSYKTFRDQFGRKWGAHIEMNTRQSVGRIEYQEHHERGSRFPFYPPFLPPQKYLQENEATDLLGIDFGRWKADTLTANREYEGEAIKMGRAIHKDAFDPANPYTREVLQVIGPRPNPIEPIVALEKGNPWILGETDVPDIRLAPFFERRREDVSAAIEDRYGDFGMLVTGDEGAESESEMEEEWPQPHGVGRWRLSDGTVMQGKRDAANVAQAALLAAA